VLPGNGQTFRTAVTASRRRCLNQSVDPDPLKSAGLCLTPDPHQSRNELPRSQAVDSFDPFEGRGGSGCHGLLFLFFLAEHEPEKNRLEPVSLPGPVACLSSTPQAHDEGLSLPFHWEDSQNSAPFAVFREPLANLWSCGVRTVSITAPFIFVGAMRCVSIRRARIGSGIHSPAIPWQRLSIGLLWHRRDPGSISTLADENHDVHE